MSLLENYGLDKNNLILLVNSNINRIWFDPLTRSFISEDLVLKEVQEYPRKEYLEKRIKKIPDKRYTPAGNYLLPKPWWKIDWSWVEQEAFLHGLIAFCLVLLMSSLVGLLIVAGSGVALATGLAWVVGVSLFAAFFVGFITFLLNL